MQYKNELFYVISTKTNSLIFSIKGYKAVDNSTICNYSNYTNTTHMSYVQLVNPTSFSSNYNQIRYEETDEYYSFYNIQGSVIHGKNIEQNKNTKVKVSFSKKEIGSILDKFGGKYNNSEIIVMPVEQYKNINTFLDILDTYTYPWPHTRLCTKLLSYLLMMLY